MIKILIADDHAVVRKGLKQIISETHDMLVAGETTDGFETIVRVCDNAYDVILLDITMPGTNGLEVLKQIKKKNPKQAILILSVHPEDQYAIRALRAGASGYLTKWSAPDELIAAIRKISKGGKYITSSVAEKLISEREKYPDLPRHEMLSDREYQVMCMFVSGKTLKEIAQDLCLSVQTISTYKARILEKMGMNSLADVVRYAVKYGLVE